jgi:hypothetical protein
MRSSSRISRAAGFQKGLSLDLDDPGFFPAPNSKRGGEIRPMALRCLEVPRGGFAFTLVIQVH